MDSINLLKSWKAHALTLSAEKSKIEIATLKAAQTLRFTAADMVDTAQQHGIFIELSKNILEQLRLEYVVYDEDKQKNILKDPLSFAFPLLKTYQDKKEYYQPLFFTNVPPSLLLDESSTGFNIQVLEPTSVAPNIALLTAIFDLDEDDIVQSANMLDMVGEITKAKYGSFKEMYEALIVWIKNRLAERGLSNRFSFPPHIDGLIYVAVPQDHAIKREVKDFDSLIKTFDKSSTEFMAKYPLLYQYMTYKSSGQDLTQFKCTTEQPIFGLFEKKYPLGRGQFQSIQANAIDLKSPPLLAVQGAPGTGKTTLFKSLMAQQVVARALAIIDGNDKNMNMLVVSAAINAVENVIADLKGDDVTQELNWLWLHGGAKAKLDIELSTRMEPHIEYLKNTEYSNDDHDSYKVLLTTFREVIKDRNNSYLDLVSSIGNIINEIPFSFDESSIVHLLECLQTYSEESLSVRSLPNAKNLEELKCYLMTERKEVEATLNKVQNDNSLINEAFINVSPILKFWPSVFTVTQFAEWMLNQPVHGKFSLQVKHYPNLLLIKVLTWINPAKKQLFEACEYLTRYAELESIQVQIKQLKMQLGKYQHLIATVATIEKFIEVKTRLDKDYPYKDYTDMLRLSAIEEQRLMFEVALKFLEQEQLKRKDDLIPALEHWKNLLSSADYKPYKNSKTEFFKLISLAYPIVASTLTSAYKMSGFKTLNGLDVRPWNLVLLDEAGMVSVESMVHVLSRANTAMIVGDPLQLEPIRTISQRSMKIIKEDYYKDDTENFLMAGPGQATAYHRAAGALTGGIDDIGSGIVLDEHRRCQKPIAELFIEIAKYTNVNIETSTPNARVTEAFNKMGGYNLMFYDIEGCHGSKKTNIDEADAIDGLLTRLDEAGYDLFNDVGIITPYADQKRLLISRFGKRLNHDVAAKIGTVHQFQGVGFEVIIFSTVIFTENDNSSFLNNKPNLLNVAVSRAKQQFIIVGNYRKLESSKGYLGIMAKHAAQSFYLELGQQSESFNDHLNDNFENMRYLYDCQHIAAFKEYLSSCETSIKIVAPWIRNPYKNTAQEQLELLKSAKARGIDIKVYYGYNNENLNLDNGNDQKLIDQYILALGQENVIRIAGGTHEKILIVDDKFIVIGSWNWLSNAYYNWCCAPKKGTVNLAIRKETSIILNDRKLISDYKNKLFD